MTGRKWYNIRMKKATYKLIVHYNNGDRSMRGGLTQKRCYEILNRYQEDGWRSGDHYIDAWEITTGKKEIEF